jgi:hypothetical protein
MQHALLLRLHATGLIGPREQADLHVRCVQPPSDASSASRWSESAAASLVEVAIVHVCVVGEHVPVTSSHVHDVGKYKAHGQDSPDAGTVVGQGTVNGASTDHLPLNPLQTQAYPILS